LISGLFGGHKTLGLKAANGAQNASVDTAFEKITTSGIYQKS